jgi:hypothetical protein
MGARGAALLLGALTLAACERELPTDVGGEHLPEASLRTYEIILDADVFLESDSVLRGFGTTNTTSLLLVAENYRDTLDAHGLVQFGDFPETVTFVDTTGTHTDTITRFAGGRLVVRIDTTTLFLGDEPIDSLPDSTEVVFQIHTVTESFDTRTATWRAREVTGTDSLFWTTPGGTPGTLIGTRAWISSDSATGDSIAFDVDSAIIAAWEAGTEPKAIMVSAVTSGVRAHVIVPRLQLTARFELEDTTITRTTSTVVTAQTFVYDPPPPAPVDELRVGDRSAWRSFLTFADRLDSLTIQCPDEPDCSFRLGDVTVNRAELRLTPLEVASVFRPRSTIAVELRPVLADEALPLERAPLGDTTGIAFGIEPGNFVADSDSIARIGVSRFVRGLLGASTDTVVTDRNRTVALLSSPEPLLFGIGRFGGVESSSAPVLRLIVTLPPREEEE